MENPPPVYTKSPTVQPAGTEPQVVTQVVREIVVVKEVEPKENVTTVIHHHQDSGSFDAGACFGCLLAACCCGCVIQ